LKKSGIRSIVLVFLLVLLFVSMSSFVHADIFINEFLADGIIEPDSEWVELYNNGSSSVDLTNYNITESGASANVTLNGTIPVNGFVVLAENFTLFNSTYPDVNISGIRIIEYGAAVASFQLHNTAGNITLYNSSGSRINNVSYSSSSENVSEGRFPDGNESFSTFTAQTPGAKNDNAAPVFNKWVKPSANASFIASLFNITVNITDQTYAVNTSFIQFNGTNFTMNRSGDIWHYLLNTSKYLETAASSTYNITMHFNDSIGLSNSNTLFNISIDNTFPNITSPNTTANSRNFVSPGFVFNASVNASDENLLNVTCLLDGTSYGYFANISNKTFICNLTAPLTEDTYTINFTVFDKANNTNTTTINFTTRYRTSQTLIRKDITISNLNISDKIVQVNATLNNTGTNMMYETGIILQAFSTGNLSATSVSYKSCSVNLSASQVCNATFNLTVKGGANSSHLIYWNVNWTDNNLTTKTLSTFPSSTVTISQYPQMTVTENRSATISHNANKTLATYINVTGNTKLENVNITYASTTLPASWLDIIPQNFSAISSNTTFDVNVTVPKATNPGNYTGTLYINATNTENKTILLRVEIPTDSSWTTTPKNKKTYRQSNKPGLLGTLYINNSGNIGQNFSFSFAGSLYEYIWNSSNPAHNYVERDTRQALNFYHLGASGPLTTYNLTITITSKNTSTVNVTYMNLTRDDASPVVSITNPSNNSFVNGTFGFNASVSELNLSNIEFSINGILVLNDTGLNYTFRWNTTNGSYPDNIYTLKVTAYDTANSLGSLQINVTVNNTDDSPVLRASIPTINWTEDSITTFNLSNHFRSIDNDTLKYNFSLVNNITIHVNNNTGIANFTPAANFSGIRYVIFYALDSNNNATPSNNATLNVTSFNDAPTTPNLVRPVDGSNVSSSTGKGILSWNASIDADNDQVTYYVFLSNDSSNIAFNGTTTAVNLQLTDLVANETYFWYVIASDDSLNSSNSSMFNFTMLRDNDPVINKWTWNNTINISSTNTTPFVAENKTLSFEINASDPDNNSINFTWFRDNVEISNLQNFTFNLTNNFTAAGSYVLKLKVQDNNSNSVEQDWSVTVTNTNREPLLDTITNKNATEDSVLKFNITFVDSDNNSITLTSNISTISFTKDANNSLATVSWTPTNDNVGNNTISFVVNDSLKSDSKTIVISVDNTDDAPTITEFFPIENKTIADGIGSQLFNVTFSDIDAGEDAAAYWFGNSTADMPSNSSNVTVAGLSTGIYNITAIVNDTSGNATRYEWALTVTTGIIFDGLASTILEGLNQSDRESVTNVTINQSTFGGIDFGNETMNFSRIANLEDAFNISNGVISVDTVSYPELNRNASIVMKDLNFTKAPLIYNASGFENTDGNVCPDDICTNITYDAANGILRFNVPHFSTYYTQTNTTNGAPVITSAPVTKATERAQYTYDVEATDPDGDVLIFSLITRPSGMSISSSSGVISWTPILSQLGLNNVTVNVSDGSLNTTQSFQINVDKGPKLAISDLDVKVDKKTDKNLNNNTKIDKEAVPGSIVEFKLEIENLFTDEEDLKIKDIDVEITIEDIDDGDDLAEDADEFDIKPEKNKDVSIEFDIPLEVDEDIYDVIINVEGKDENGTTHAIIWGLELEVEKESHEIRIIRAALTPSTIRCQRQISINTEIINTGSDDEDDVTLEATSADLGISSLTADIELDEGTDDNRFTKLFTRSISADVAPGIYPITINAYYGSTLSESKTVDLTVEDCELVKKIKKEVKEEKPKVEVILPKVVKEEKPKADVSFVETEGYIVLLVILTIMFIGTAIFIVGAGFILLRK